MSAPGFFDFEERCQQLSAHGDPLETLNSAIDFELFRPMLERVRNKPRKDNSGRKPFDVVLMFKVLVVQSLYGLSDNAMERRILDSISTMRFLGFQLGDKVPDEKTIWVFKEQLTRLGLYAELFKAFESMLVEAGYAAKQGSLIDASIVEAPRQRNARSENDQIKRGERPESFDANPSRGRQKDTDARWTRKRNTNYFGYKNHVNVDRKHKLIRRYTVTSASVHDSQPIEVLLDKNNSNKDVYADSAYRSQEIADQLEAGGYRDRIHRKGYRNRPLTERAKQANNKKSKIRVRVEHVFGRMHHFGDGLVRSIGLARAEAVIGLRNLVYNMDRYAYLERR